jgi:hypothetical protein
LNLTAIGIKHFTGHSSAYGLDPLLNFDYEANIPTYFSTINLLLCAVLSYFIYKSNKDTQTNQKRWAILAIVFVLLSIEETVRIHEFVSGPLRDMLGVTSGWLYCTWLIPGVVILLIFSLYFFKFYRNLPKRYKILFGVSLYSFSAARS